MGTRDTSYFDKGNKREKVKMSGTLSFKVYMRTEENESKVEVRRFGIEVDAVTSFLYLREKIQTIFPALRGKHFTISWKDSEGDNVCISSDEELEIALNETPDEVRKLHVLLHSEYEMQKNSAPASEGPLHTGTTCDGCESGVRGYRYKCLQCPDYDLCADCEASGMHPEHCMIRISMPLQWKPNMGKRLASQVNKFMRRAQPHRSPEDEQPKSQCPHRSARHAGRTRRGAEDSSWLETFATYLDEWANLPGECPAKEAAKQCSAAAAANEAKKNPSPEPSARSSEEKPKCPLSDGANASEQIKLLKNVGLVVGENFISQFLDPLLNMHVAPEKPEAPRSNAEASTSTNGGNREETAAPTPSAPEATEAPKFPGEGKKLSDGVAAAAPAAAANGNDEAAPSVQERKQSEEKAFIESELGWTLLNKTDGPASNSGASSTGAVPKQVTPSAAPETTSKSIYPELPAQKEPEEKPVYHPNPTIQKSVESMIAMGFSNNGGWLTNLLVSKGGDIAAALDALSPARR